MTLHSSLLQTRCFVYLFVCLFYIKVKLCRNIQCIKFPMWFSALEKWLHSSCRFWENSDCSKSSSNISDTSFTTFLTCIMRQKSIATFLKSWAGRLHYTAARTVLAIDHVSQQLNLANITSYIFRCLSIQNWLEKFRVQLASHSVLFPWLL